MESRRLVFSNLIWRFMERCGAQGISFIVSLVLARLLDPVVYGTVALITVFTAILQVFVDSGLGNALIQKKDADDVDFSSVFYVSMGICLTLYTGMFLAAPYIADFYGLPELIPLIRVQSLLLVVSGVKNVQQAYVSRNMMFKRFFYATLGGTVASGAAGIWMAWRGYGAWALVTASLMNAVVDTLILWLTVKWRPKRLFSLHRLKGLLSFSWKILACGLIDTVYNNLRQLLIGKLYTKEDLAFYNKGEVFPSMVIGNINSSISSVLLPAMAAEQDFRSTLRGMTRRSIRTSSYIIWPMMVGLSVCAVPMVRLILTEKWLPCVPYLRILCVTYAFWPIHTTNLSAINALGRSDIALKLEIWKKLVGFILLLISLPYGTIAIALSALLSSLVSQVINAWPNRALLDYSYLQQLRDILPSIGLSLLMGACVWPVTLLHLGDWTTLFIQVPLGVVIYVAGSVLFKLESFTYLWDLVKTFLRKTKS